jgi:hypothetical protein
MTFQLIAALLRIHLEGQHQVAYSSWNNNISDSWWVDASGNIRGEGTQHTRKSFCLETNARDEAICDCVNSVVDDLCNEEPKCSNRTLGLIATVRRGITGRMNRDSGSINLSVICSSVLEAEGPQDKGQDALPVPALGLSGSTYVQKIQATPDNAGVGVASYHFVDETQAFIDYSNAPGRFGTGSRAPFACGLVLFLQWAQSCCCFLLIFIRSYSSYSGHWALDDGSPLPPVVFFQNVVADEEARFFGGDIRSVGMCMHRAPHRFHLASYKLAHAHAHTHNHTHARAFCVPSCSAGAIPPSTGQGRGATRCTSAKTT